MIRFIVVVHTAIALGVGEQVFLTGSPDELGTWTPDALPMTRVSDNRWEVVLTLRTAAPFEYKITRGSWETEEVDAEGHWLPNRVMNPFERGIETLEIAGWKDDHPARPPQITGNYRIWSKVESTFLDFPRDVIIWLPPGYEQKPSKTYPVLYMHDARQVFDPNTSTWGKDWQVDEHAQEMILNGEIEEIIVVAADCTEARFSEYDPEQRGKAYIRFLMEELKPRIDAEFRTEPKRNYIAGSSMGGLISFYAAWMHPDVFIGAACLSPAFRLRDGTDRCTLMVEDSREHLPAIRLFLSCGGEGELEARLLQGTLQMADTLKQAGFPESQMSVRIEGWAEHNEEAWSRMTPHWLRFLFGRH